MFYTTQTMLKGAGVARDWLASNTRPPPTTFMTHIRREQNSNKNFLRIKLEQDLKIIEAVHAIERAQVTRECEKKVNLIDAFVDHIHNHCATETEKETEEELVIHKQRSATETETKKDTLKKMFDSVEFTHFLPYMQVNKKRRIE